MGQTPCAAALWYASRGWSVLPLLPGKKAPFGKLVHHGVRSASADEARIRGWWAKGPMANVGIAAGLSGLVIVDVDVHAGKHGMESWRAMVAELGSAIEDTVAARTPSGGLHFYYRATGDEIGPSVDKLGDGLDVRAGYAYVGAPPSRTASGAYEWLAGHSPAECGVAELPAEIERRLLVASDRNETKSDASPDRVQSRARFRPEQMIADDDPREALAGIAGWLRARGLDDDDVLAGLMEVNANCCAHPLDILTLAQVADGATVEADHGTGWGVQVEGRRLWVVEAA